MALCGLKKVGQGSSGVLAVDMPASMTVDDLKKVIRDAAPVADLSTFFLERILSGSPPGICYYVYLPNSLKSEVPRHRVGNEKLSTIVVSTVSQPPEEQRWWMNKKHCLTKIPGSHR